MSRPSSSPLLQRALSLQLATRQKTSALRWLLLDSSLFLIFAYDLSCKCPHYTSYFHLAEYALATVLALNALYHAVRYLYLLCSMTPVSITPAQKKLLGFSDLDTSFRLKSAEIARPPSPELNQSEPFSITSRSWLSNSSPNASPQSVTSTSWSFQRGSPPSPKNTSASLNFSTQEDFISDRNSLEEYLRHFEQKEAMSPLNSSMDGSEPSATMWSPAPELPPRLRPQYQLATLNTATSATEEGAGGSGPSSPHVWWRLHLDPQHLTQWNLNLRLWISTTILERLVREIGCIDDALQKHGLSDVKVGLVGLERLRKTATTALAARHVPTLQALVPFLELSNKQEYLVQRIRELAHGGCMSAYKWNGGGTFKDQAWEESLPTDSELIMHLLATYLDTQLLPVTQNPDGKPFTSQHFSRSPAKPRRALNALAVHQAGLRPPHYVLVKGEEMIEVAKGRNNLIHTILLFLHMVVTKHHGMLGRVNLGKSGVNILWVIDR